MGSVINLKVASEKEKNMLKKLSTENLIIWIIGKSTSKKFRLTEEEIVLECWLINPQKHSMRGFSEFPDSHVILKRIGEMRGKKGLLQGSSMGGYSLTDLSKFRYADIDAQISSGHVSTRNSPKAIDRSISSIDEAPYYRLINTPAYKKFIEGRIEQIVETDFLFFYGINWHSKRSFIQSKIKNIDAIVNLFSKRDNNLPKVKEFLNNKFILTRESLIKNDYEEKA